MTTTTKAATHTPGPWETTGIDVIAKVSTPGDNRTLLVVRLNDSSTCQSQSTNEANARLIAAAPEMLEALERLYHEWEILACQCIGSEETNAGHKNCIVSKGLPWVDAAIQKARGGQ